MGVSIGAGHMSLFFLFFTLSNFILVSSIIEFSYQICNLSTVVPFFPIFLSSNFINHDFKGIKIYQNLFLTRFVNCYYQRLQKLDLIYETD